MQGWEGSSRIYVHESSRLPWTAILLSNSIQADWRREHALRRMWHMWQVYRGSVHQGSDVSVTENEAIAVDESKAE